MSAERTRRIVFWALLAVTVCVIVWRLTGSGTPARDEAARSLAGDPSAAERGDGAEGTAAERAARVRRGGGGVVVEEGAPEGVDYHELYANFLTQTRYPPLSRPLEADQLDLLEPNARHEGPIAITDPKGNRRPDPGDVYHALFTGDRYAILGDETLAVTFKVWKGDDEQGLPVKLDAMTAVAFGTFGEEDLGPVPIAPVKGPAGTVYQATVAPARMGATRVGDYRLDLYFQTPDGEDLAGHLDFFYTPAAAIPARFTGRFREELRSGSLVISAEVAVTTAGTYDINANLFDERGAPVASSRFLDALEAKKQWVDLMFYGLIFRDKHASGAFALRTLRGARMQPGETPDRAWMPGLDAPYRTSSYDADDFTSDEWDSPDKQAQIKMYQQRMREQEEGVPPAPLEE